MKSIHYDDYAAFIGIDWADRKHDICLQCAGTDRREFGQIQHTPQSISAWVKTLQKRFGQRPIAVCCELRKGPLIYALARYPQLVLFPLNPITVAKYREAFGFFMIATLPLDLGLPLCHLHFSVNWGNPVVVFIGSTCFQAVRYLKTLVSRVRFAGHIFNHRP
jgi:hypothetical protein